MRKFRKRKNFVVFLSVYPFWKGALNWFHETIEIQAKNGVRVERPQKNDVKRCYCYDAKQQQQQGETDDGSCGENISSEGG